MRRNFDRVICERGETCYPLVKHTLLRLDDREDIETTKTSNISKYCNASIRVPAYMAVNSFDPKDIARHPCKICDWREDSPKHFFTGCPGHNVSTDRHSHEIPELALRLGELRRELSRICWYWWDYDLTLRTFASTHYLGETQRTTIREVSSILEQMYNVRLLLLQRRADVVRD
jgi:hypothetical protein